MANHPSAEKRARQTKQRTSVNRTRMNKIRTLLKRTEAAITSGNKTAAREALKQTQPELMRGVNKGLLKLNAAARKMSRLSARIKAMTT